MKRLLVVAPRAVATFTRQDFEQLKSHFACELFAHKTSGSLRDMSRAIARSDALLIWFAGKHAAPATLLAKRHRKPVVLIIGGYEAAWIPEINYGVNPQSMRAALLRWTLRRADRIVAVSEETKAGIARVAADVSAKVQLIYNGVSTQFFDMGKDVRRDGVVSVGMIGAGTLVKKGWKLFWETAAAMPDVQFTAVGPATDQPARELVAQCPPNLTWLGELQGDDLVRQYQMAAVYFQGSRHESFSLSLAEGMACGCIPVVTRYGALPEVAGDQGYYMSDLTPAAASEAIRNALNAPESKREAVRARMVENFDIARRREALIDLMDEVLCR